MICDEAHNLLTKTSRILPQNLVVWEETVRDQEMQRRYESTPKGSSYVGINPYLQQGDKYLRTDSLEKCSKTNKLDFVEVLAGDYLLSICKAYALDDKGKLKECWEEGKSIAGKAKRFAAVLEMRTEGKSEDEMLDAWMRGEGVTETDRIVQDLCRLGEHHMKVVRIAPGEMNEDDSGKQSDAVANTAFLKPIAHLLNQLEFHRFLLLDDFGAQKPAKMLEQKKYRHIWEKMQAVPCQQVGKNSEFLCTTFVPGKAVKCASCGHVHKKCTGLCRRRRTLQSGCASSTSCPRASTTPRWRCCER